MRVEFEGIPYADAFAVEIRWVATREGDRDINVQVGVEVDFKKSTFLKGKIRSGTIEETAPVHRNLFEAVREACANSSGIESANLIVEFNEIDAGPVTGHSEIGFFDNLILDKYVVAACGAFIVLTFLWRGIHRSVVFGTAASSYVSANEIAALGTKIDRLEAEMALMRETIFEILSIVKSKVE